MSAPNRKGTQNYAQGMAVFSFAALVAALLGGMWVSLHWGSALADLPAPPSNIRTLIEGLIKGETPWPVQATVIAVSLAVLVLAALITTVIRVVIRSGKKARVDKAARYLGKGKSLEAYTERGAKATAQRLGVTHSNGIVVGTVISSKQTFYQPWEDLSLDIWGPRTGKSTSRVIPAILDAPGVVV